MNKDYYISLFEYNKWANSQIAEVLAQSDEVPSKCKILFHHISATTETWLSRITEVDRHYNNLFEESDLKENSKTLTRLEDKWIEFLKNVKDLVTSVKYKNTKGTEFENSLIDIISHLLTHNHYHRGQINLLLRQNEIEPVVTDYILYKRQ